MPLDHFTLVVPQPAVDPLITFLTTSLSHIGFKEILRPIPNVVGLGEQAPYFWVSGLVPEGVEDESLKKLLKGPHVAFKATDAEQVKQFHAEALEAGATCNGKPGLREHYHPGYYGAFVLEPVLGLNVEVVCHKGE